jgi:hypothetical protein
MFEVFNEISSTILFILINLEKPQIYSLLILLLQTFKYIFEGREVNLCTLTEGEGSVQLTSLY